MSPPWVVTASLLVMTAPPGADDEGQDVKFADSPPAVRKTFQAEAKGAHIDTLTREKDDEGDVVYWADVTIGGTPYAVGVLEDGTLTEMNQAVDVDEIPFDRCPVAVRETFRAEGFGAKIEAVGKDIRYGVAIFEAVVAHKGKAYEVVVAEDGSLVEKVLVIDDEEVELAECPAPVQAGLRAHADGGRVAEVTRSTGLGRNTFEAEVEIKGKVYLIEVDETGRLISKSLEAGEE